MAAYCRWWERDMEDVAEWQSEECGHDCDKCDSLMVTKDGTDCSEKNIAG